MKKLGIIGVVLCMIFLVSFLLGKDTKNCRMLNGERWNIELATTPEETSRGLMYRKELCARCGMLFAFRENSPKNFWMKNTLIPLDIYFYNSSGVLVDFAKNMRPEKETEVPMDYTSQPAQYVLEVAAGSRFQPENFNPLECL